MNWYKNENLIKTDVINITRFPIRRLDLMVGVAYKEDIKNVIAVLKDIADKNPLVLDEPDPFIMFQEFGDSSLNIKFGVWVTKGRASIEAYSFIRHVLRKCDNIPKILIDKGPWYRPALQRLGLDYEHVTFGLRNPIEQWFGLLKHRIKRFNRNWPNNADINVVQEWIDAFVSLYHITRC